MWWYCGEEPNPTPCWSCFFDLLLIAFVIMVKGKDLSQRTLPLCLLLKGSAFVPDPVHLCMVRRKK